MAASTETKASTAAGRSTSLLSILFTILGLVALAVIGFNLARASSVTLTTQDQIKQVLTGGVVLSAAALVLGIVGFILALLALLRLRAALRTITTVIAILVAIAAGLFLFTTALPRAQAVQNLNDTIVPFAEALNTNCSAPLNQTTNDFKKALADTQANMTDNTAFAAAMTADAAALKTDSVAISKGLNALDAVKSPDPKYDKLLADCKATLQTEGDFLTNDSGSNAIPLPPPYSAMIPGGKVSGIDLLTDAGLVSSGLGPIQVPQGALQPLLVIALGQIVNTTNPTLTQEGDQLQSDIQSTLDNNLAPYKVDIQGL